MFKFIYQILVKFSPDPDHEFLLSAVGYDCTRS